MEIESVVHKALRRYVETGSARGLGGDLVHRLAEMISYITVAERFDELLVPPNFGLHQLTGDRTGTWSMTVTRNWRMTFKKVDEQTIADFNLEDYH